jgi:hypothetical protein
MLCSMLVTNVVFKQCCVIINLQNIHAQQQLVELYEVDDEDELSELGVEFDIHELIDMSPDERR